MKRVLLVLLAVLLVPSGADAHRGIMRTGVMGTGMPAPEQVPAAAVRMIVPQDQAPAYSQELRQGGVQPLANPTAPEPRMTDDEFHDHIVFWASQVKAWRIELGNEPPTDQWPLYFQRVLQAEPIVHNWGKRLILAASRGEEGFLAAVPPEVFNAVDGVAIHAYRPTPEDMLRAVKHFRRLVPADLPLYLTEFGWSSTDPLQAQKITDTFHLLYENREELKLRQADVFTFQDYTTTTPFGDYGLVGLDGTRRPAYYALNDVPRMRPYRKVP